MQKEEFAKYIRTRAKELGLSITKLAQQTGISRQSLYDLFSGTTEQAKLSTVVSLSNTLQVHPVHLFRYLIDQVESPRYGEKDAADAIELVRDVTIPANTEVKVGKKFTKTWEIKNAGEKNWTGRQLVCMDQPIDPAYVPPRSKNLITCRGLLPVSREVNVKDTKAGKTVTISVEFTAPTYPCTVLSYWQLTDEAGNVANLTTEGLSCYVRVVE
jgi:transcriptional regulator with XRE-family HTH domain